jgi:hypothetical protein
MLKFTQFINESLKDEDLHDIEGIFIGLEDDKDIQIEYDVLSNRITVRIYNKLKLTDPIILDQLIKYNEKELFISQKLVTIFKRLDYFNFSYSLEKEQTYIYLEITKTENVNLDEIINSRRGDETTLRLLLKKDYNIILSNFIKNRILYLKDDNLIGSVRLSKLLDDLKPLNMGKLPKYSKESSTDHGVDTHYIKIELDKK